MVRTALSVVVLVLGLAAAAAGQTQMELNDQSCRAAKQTDKELNAVYTGILQKYAGEAEFLAKFKTAQRAWLAFRDAHIESVYPAKDKTEYGSIYNLCYCELLGRLTRERTEQIRPWLDGIEQGGACAGSLPVKP